MRCAQVWCLSPTAQVARSGSEMTPGVDVNDVRIVAPRKAILDAVQFAAERVLDPTTTWTQVVIAEPEGASLDVPARSGGS